MFTDLGETRSEPTQVFDSAGFEPIGAFFLCIWEWKTCHLVETIIDPGRGVPQTLSQTLKFVDGGLILM
jgi:hypothetical protein